MITTIFEGGRQTGKTTELIKLVAQRVSEGEDCWVFCGFTIKRDFLVEFVNKAVGIRPTRMTFKPGRLEYPNGTQVRFSIARENWEMDLRNVDSSKYHLFLDDCEYTDQYQSVLDNQFGWASKTVTRCIGPDAANI